MSFVLLTCLLAATPDAGLLARRVDLTADHLSLDSKARRGTYTGHAKAVRDHTTLTCDALEVAFDAQQQVSTITARGNVVAVDGDREAHGDEATFDNATGVLVVHGHPWGKQGTREVEGETVTFTSDTDTLVIDQAHTRTKDVKPTGAASTEQRVIIDADQLVLEQKKATAVWKGHVKAVRGPTTLFAPELDATWNDAGEITRMVARGGVEAIEPTRQARGRTADFDVVRGVLVVTGNPEATQGKNRMRGSKVTFFPNSEFVEVENVTSVIAVDKDKGKGKKKQEQK
jgi:lipopolysaccharide export system protein LptA